MNTTLLIMATGIGSRFGTGIKQLEPVDDAGHITSWTTRSMMQLRLVSTMWYQERLAGQARQRLHYLHDRGSHGLYSLCQTKGSQTAG